MMKKIMTLFVVLAIGATAAYQMGWLSSKGEKAYDNTKESLIEKSENIIDKTKDTIK